MGKDKEVKEHSHEQNELQNMYIELQILDQQIKQAQKQLEHFEQQVGELAVTVEALDSLKDIKPGTRLLVPLNSGIFVEAELKDNTNLKVNVGANINVSKTVDETKKLIEEQLNEIKAYREKLFIKLQTLVARAQSIERHVSEHEAE